MAGMSGDRCRDTTEPRRQQVCYLSQSEGEDLASRPWRTRGCPRHEGTQGLRSLWAKRTELLRSGAGAALGHHGHASWGDGGPPPGRKTPVQGGWGRVQGRGRGFPPMHLPPRLVGPWSPSSSMALSAASGRVSCLGSCPHAGLQPPSQPQREVVGGRLLQLWVPIRLLVLCAPAGGLGVGQENGWTVGPQPPTSAGRL